jgi:type IV pilus assembly protein PilA
MIVVAIVGVLAVLGSFAVRKYMATAKSAEARNSLGQISKDAASAFEKESTNTTIVASGNSTSLMRALCTSSTRVPASVPAAMKYQSTNADWGAGSPTQGWTCLKFSISQPQYYSYQYIAFDTSAVAGVYQANAWGDLNGDSSTSHFWVNGSVQGAQLTVSPVVNESNPED